MIRLSLRTWPIRRKLLLLALLASALPVAAAIVTTYGRASVLLRQQATELITARADQLAGELDALHGTYATMTGRLAALPAMALYAGAADADRGRWAPEIQATLDVHARSDEHLRAIAVLDQSGRVLAASDPGAVGLRLDRREYVKRALAGEIVTSDVFVGIPTSRPSIVVAFAAPIRSEGRPVGAIALYLNASTIAQIVRAANGRAGAGSFSVLYDALGIRIAHSFNEREVFVPGGPLDPAVVSRLTTERRFGEQTSGLLASVSSAPEEFRRVVAPHADAPDVFVGHSPANDQDNLAVTRRLTTVPWTLFVLVPVSSVTSSIGTLTVGAASIGLLIVALALAAAALLSRDVMTPLTELERAAAAMQRGELETRIPVRASDEIGAVAKTFNEMAASLEAARDRLEHRVRERTLELERANEELRAQQDELRAQKTELNERAEELRRADRLKSEFLANMSHELRTPLNAILGFTELVRDGDGGEVSKRQREHLEQVLASGRHLLALINDILDLAKVESGRMSLTPTAVHLQSAIAEARSLVRPQAERRGLSIESDESVSLDVTADPAKLRQILVNLLSNAVKFSRDEGKIRIHADLVGPFVVKIAVVDHGAGIDPALAPRLFQPFVQGESPLVKRHQGTGLGLAISKRLVEAHGGTIGFEPTPGGGATFWFTLALASSRASAPSRPVGRKRSLLLVDQAIDDASSRTFEEAGFEVVSFDNGRSVLEVATELRPAAIVVDPASVQRDGVALLDALARTAGTRQIPVVIRPMSSAATLVAKPIEGDALLAAIQAAVARTSSPRILAIDDDPRVLELLDALLSRAGYRIETAATGREGLAKAAASAMDLFIVDLTLPDLTGFEVIDALLASPETREQPIVVLTAKDLDPDEGERLRSKVAALTRKGDLTAEELVACIERALGRRSDGAEGPCVLVVDDNDANRELVRAILETAGYRVIGVSDGEEAVAAAHRDAPALILMDLAMPKKDGYTAARELKQDPSTADIPIVALTALAMTGDEERAFAAGMDGYVTKPVDRRVLQETVARFLRGPVKR